jgi:hypothetical protein
MFTFYELEIKYGPAAAYQCLVEIEKAAQIRPETGDDLEARLANALAVQDSVLELQAA